MNQEFISRRHPSAVIGEAAAGHDVMNVRMVYLCNNCNQPQAAGIDCGKGKLDSAGSESTKESLAPLRC